VVRPDASVAVPDDPEFVLEHVEVEAVLVALGVEISGRRGGVVVCGEFDRGAKDRTVRACFVDRDVVLAGSQLENPVTSVNSAPGTLTSPFTSTSTAGASGTA
jgi:hypothetical protein